MSLCLLVSSKKQNKQRQNLLMQMVRVCVFLFLSFLCKYALAHGPGQKQVLLLPCGPFFSPPYNATKQKKEKKNGIQESPT